MFLVKGNSINWTTGELRLLSYPLLALECRCFWDSLVIQFVELGPSPLLGALKNFPSFPDTMEASNISNLKSLLANSLAQTTKFVKVSFPIDSEVPEHLVYTRSRSRGSCNLICSRERKRKWQIDQNTGNSVPQTTLLEMRCTCFSYF